MSKAGRTSLLIADEEVKKSRKLFPDFEQELITNALVIPRKYWVIAWRTSLCLCFDETVDLANIIGKKLSCHEHERANPPPPQARTRMQKREHEKKMEQAVTQWRSPPPLSIRVSLNVQSKMWQHNLPLLGCDDLKVQLVPLGLHFNSLKYMLKCASKVFPLMWTGKWIVVVKMLSLTKNYKHKCWYIRFFQLIYTYDRNISFIHTHECGPGKITFRSLQQFL